jgi:hypothetical protein
MLTVTRLLLLPLPLLCVGSLRADDWPQWRGRTGTMCGPRLAFLRRFPLTA